MLLCPRRLNVTPWGFPECFLVAALTSQPGERTIGGLFFIENFFKDTGGFLVAQNSGPLMQAAICRYFVMLDLLRCADQRRIDGGRSAKTS